MKKMKKRFVRGFTLVEMITTITILGVVSLVALPVINSVSDEFTKRKFEMYEESLISASKLYVDQNGDDLFGDADDGCADVGYAEIEEKELIKDIELDNATCVSPNTYVRVKKKGSVYDYSVSITCMLKGEVAYEKTLEEATSCMPIGRDPDDPSNVYIPTSTTITSDPKKSDTPSKSISATILISDERGFAPNAKIQYYWINSSNHDALVGEKNTHNFKNALVKTSHTLKLPVSTPSNASGDLKLVVEPVSVVTGDGRTITEKYISDVFKIDNTAPKVVIKAHSYENNVKGNLVKQSTDADLVISDWSKSGYYFDFSASSDNYGIVKQTWKWNKTNNVNMITDYAGGSEQNNTITNKTFTGHGARYGTVTMCDTAGNCTSKNIKVNISTVYTIKYTAGSGSGTVSNTTCYYGINCKLASNAFTRLGYTFSKWKIENNLYAAGANVLNLSTQEGGSVTATAQWNANTYKIKYAANGGSGTTNNTTCTYDSNCKLANSGFSRTGYRFANWKINSTTYNAGDNVKNLVSSSGGEITATAQWNVNSYKIKYDANGGSGTTNTTTCTYDSDCKLANNGFSRYGYRFAGWKINSTTYSAGNNVKNLTSTHNGEVTATAQWDAIYHTVYYHVNDSVSYNGVWATRSVQVGAGIDTSLNPQGVINEFRQFNGWNNNPGTMPDRDVTLNASISDQMCRVVTGHGSFDRVDAFRGVFANAGWSGATTEQFYWEGWYWRVVTQYNMTHAQADAAMIYVWNHTSATGAHALNYITLECANGYSYYLRRPWS